MSANYILYEQKMLEIRAARRLGRPLQSQLEEVFRFAQDCERKWNLDEPVDSAEVPQRDI